MSACVTLVAILIAACGDPPGVDGGGATSTSEGTGEGEEGTSSCEDNPSDWGYFDGCVGPGWSVSVEWDPPSVPGCPERNVEVTAVPFGSELRTLMRSAETFEIHGAQQAPLDVTPPPEIAQLSDPAFAADLDLDGVVDLVSATNPLVGASPGTNQVAVAWGSTDGSFSPWELVGETLEYNLLTKHVVRLSNGGVGLLEGPTDLGTVTRIWSFENRQVSQRDLGNIGGRVIAAADVDGDGLDDLVHRSNGTLGADEAKWFVSFGAGSDAFDAPLVVDGSPPAVKIYASGSADLDGDGDAEVLVSEIETPGYLGAFDWDEISQSFQIRSELRTGVAVYAFDTVDANQDGKAELFYGGWLAGGPNDDPVHEMGVFMSDANPEPLLYSGPTTHRFALRRAGANAFEVVIGDGPAIVSFSADDTCR